MTYSIVIIGPKTFKNETLFNKVMNALCNNEFQTKTSTDYELVIGNDTWLDRMGIDYAVMHELKYAIFPANWSHFNKNAGPIRAEQMFRHAKKSDQALIVAFCDKNEITGVLKRAAQMGIPIKYVNTKEN